MLSYLVIRLSSQAFENPKLYSAIAKVRMNGKQVSGLDFDVHPLCSLIDLHCWNVNSMDACSCVKPQSQATICSGQYDREVLRLEVVETCDLLSLITAGRLPYNFF